MSDNDTKALKAGPCKHGFDYAELDAEGFAVWKSCGCKITAPIDSKPALEDPTLGCGGSSFYLGESDPYYLACRTHDYRYTMHHLGDESMTLEQANEEFARNVERLNQQHDYPWYTRLRGALYVRLVKLFGRRFWANASKTKSDP